MCFESPPCNWFWFNPEKGTNGCKKPKDEICTAELCGECERHIDECVCDEEEE